MFKTGEYEGKYSQFDERGVPTHDAAGAELNKSQKKKHEKIYAAQKKKFDKAVAAGEISADPKPEVAEAPEAVPAVAEVEEEVPCPLNVVAGTFGNRQGYEVQSNMGPFTHSFTF